MRTLAQYAFEANSQDASAAETLFRKVAGLVEKWLHAKGDTDAASKTIALDDGRTGQLEVKVLSSSIGSTSHWAISEPSSGGIFTTSIATALSGRSVFISCNLSGGFSVNVVAPVGFDARCPQVVRDIIELSKDWRVGETTVASKATVFSDEGGGESLQRLLLSHDRSLPVIAISRSQGFLLHPDIAERMARDLAGLAIVVELGEKASWVLTRDLGKTYSCFNGGIRVYWPGFEKTAAPLRHPLWTSQRLMRDVPTTEAASTRIRNVLRRKIFATSAFAVQVPHVFERIELQHQKETLETRIREAVDTSDYKQLSELYEVENADLRKKLIDEKKITQQLREDLYRLQTTQAWTNQEDDVVPVTETPPATVEEAVQRARKVFAAELTFGNDVEEGTRTIALDAGPPDKIYDYLQHLAELAKALRAGPLGDTTLNWLRLWGIQASNESETITNTKDEMRKRTWHDGRADRQFEMHLKPAEATSPDRCVRIYFDWDKATEKVVVGWVGKHP